MSSGSSIEAALPVIDGDFKQWPDFWFQRLLRAVREGNFSEADQAQRELDRLGWEVKPKAAKVPR